MFWLAYDTDKGRCVFLQPGPSLAHARLVANMSGMSEASFTEGHQIDAETIKKIPKDMIGKCLSLRQAQSLLKRIAS